MSVYSAGVCHVSLSLFNKNEIFQKCGFSPELYCRSPLYLEWSPCLQYLDLNQSLFMGSWMSLFPSIEQCFAHVAWVLYWKTGISRSPSDTSYYIVPGHASEFVFYYWRNGAVYLRFCSSTSKVLTPLALPTEAQNQPQALLLATV